MSTARPIATLTPRLLARKGSALPAMRAGNAGGDATLSLADSQNDLGWNDMGGEDVASPPARAPRAVNDDRESRAAFTLRLDPERHLKLRLACTIRSTSAQVLVTEALDRFLSEFPQLVLLAAQIGRTSGKA